MKKTIVLLKLIIATSVLAETTAKDYLNIGEQIKFNGMRYNLVWSDNPHSANYYKQEYLQEEATLDNYNEMITVDVIKGDITVIQAMQIKISELTELKKANPVVNYNVYENKKLNQYILDFALTDGNDLYEWNLYRYMTEGKGSKKHLILIAYTYRNRISDRDSMLRFFGRITDTRVAMIESLYEVNLPRIEFE